MKTKPPSSGDCALKLFPFIFIIEKENIAAIFSGNTWTINTLAIKQIHRAALVGPCGAVGVCGSLCGRVGVLEV